MRIIDGVTLRDVSRERDIPIKIYEPPIASSREALNVPGAALPLIIFSHGYGSNKEGYRYLAQGWARAGYVVILPTHQGGDRAALQAKGVGAIRNGLAVSADQLLNNARDVSFILSSLDEIRRRVPQFKASVDRSKIGVAGHSMGAGTTLILAGATLPGRTSKASDSPGKRLCRHFATRHVFGR